jgi:hypothetical protein
MHDSRTSTAESRIFSAKNKTFIFAKTIKIHDMRISLLLLAVLFSGAAFGQTKNNIEAAEYDPINNRYFVSNGSSILVTSDGGNTWSAFGNAVASHGMEVMGNTLFAISGDFVRGYDLTTEEEVMEIEITNASFLNGMGNNGTDLLYITDFGASRILEINVSDLSNPTVTTVVNNTGTTPNGIVVDNDNNRAVFVNWGSNAPIIEMDLDTYELNTLTNSGLSNCDGIDNDSYGNFYVSSWQPTRITRYSDNFSNSEIITAPGLSSPADISYAQSTDTLAIANSGNDNVTFIYFDQSNSMLSNEDRPLDVQLIQNPLNESSALRFNLNTAASANISLFSIDGKLALNFFEGQLPAGDQKVLFAGMNLAAGNYILQLQINGELVHSQQVVKQ